MQCPSGDHKGETEGENATEAKPFRFRPHKSGGYKEVDVSVIKGVTITVAATLEKNSDKASSNTARTKKQVSMKFRTCRKNSEQKTHGSAEQRRITGARGNGAHQVLQHVA